MTSGQLWSEILPKRQSVPLTTYNLADSIVLLIEGIENIFEEEMLEWDFEMTHRRKEAIQSIREAFSGEN